MLVSKASTKASKQASEPSSSYIIFKIEKTISGIFRGVVC